MEEGNPFKPRLAALALQLFIVAATAAWTSASFNTKDAADA